jgi:hypothetical protein
MISPGRAAKSHANSQGRDAIGIRVAGESGSRTQRAAEAEKVAAYQAAPAN